MINCGLTMSNLNNKHYDKKVSRFYIWVQKNVETEMYLIVMDIIYKNFCQKEAGKDFVIKQKIKYSDSCFY